MKVTPLTWHNSFLFLSLLTAIQTELSQAAFKEDKTSKTTGKSHQHHKTDVKKEKRFMNEHFPKGRVVYSFVTDRNRYLARRPHLYRAFVVRSPLRVQQSTENANGRQNIPFMEVEPTYHQPFVRVRPISRPIYYLQDTPDEQEAEFEDPLNEPVALMPEEFPAAVPIRVIMEDGAGDSDMEDLDVYAIEDMAADYAMVSSQTITLNKKGMLITFLHLNNNFGFWFLEEAKCGNNPCQNGGSCTELDAEFQCSCAPGYRGKKCQEISYCYKTPCKNGGTCTETDTGFECICPSQWNCVDCSCSAVTGVKHSLDNCFPNPCQNGGTCFSTHDGFKCLCMQGYKGKSCEVIEYCNTEPCLNGGTCKETATSYICLCKSRFRGKNCDEKEYCIPNPCKNGGTCTAEQQGYMCSCQPGFRGETCQIQEMCASNPCLHEGTCIEMDNNTFKCLCMAGWKGEHCHDKDLCIPNPCKNEGHCEAHGFSFQCHCALGFKGKSCEAKDPCSPNPCHHGGHCLSHGEVDYECECGRGYTGLKCESTVKRRVLPMITL
ncbi:Fibropellin-1 [Stylophora pistillata]|uniref:Fibropellin-1 n=1 Tax=Stylophora pistillata TaxID=50429 RepID=A0A2B4R5Q9_STYPI|nr:Fibropellin-1 [Stylophora pistillata]